MLFLILLVSPYSLCGSEESSLGGAQASTGSRKPCWTAPFSSNRLLYFHYRSALSWPGSQCNPSDYLLAGWRLDRKSRSSKHIAVSSTDSFGFGFLIRSLLVSSCLALADQSKSDNFAAAGQHCSYQAQRASQDFSGKSTTLG